MTTKVMQNLIMTYSFSSWGKSPMGGVTKNERQIATVQLAIVVRVPGLQSCRHGYANITAIDLYVLAFLRSLAFHDAKHYVSSGVRPGCKGLAQTGSPRSRSSFERNGRTSPAVPMKKNSRGAQ